MKLVVFDGSAKFSIFGSVGAGASCRSVKVQNIYILLSDSLLKSINCVVP